jgi:hypothetical protein
VSCLGNYSLAGLCKLLRRLGLRYKRGRVGLHSPDPAYAGKCATLAWARQLARCQPQRFVLLYLDELTYYRRPSLDRAYAPRGAHAQAAAQGYRSNHKRRLVGALDSQSGRVFSQHSSRCGVRELTTFLKHLHAAYPAAQQIFVALDNWPVHLHPQLQAAVANTRLRLLFLPTYAPWTNPIEKVWRKLKQEVLHLHDFADDWLGLQRAVQLWLDALTAPSPDLLRYVGLLSV